MKITVTFGFMTLHIVQHPYESTITILALWRLTDDSTAVIQKLSAEPLGSCSCIHFSSGRVAQIDHKLSKLDGIGVGAAVRDSDLTIDADEVTENTVIANPALLEEPLVEQLHTLDVYLCSGIGSSPYLCFRATALAGSIVVTISSTGTSASAYSPFRGTYYFTDLIEGTLPQVGPSKARTLDARSTER
ncbi:hypothetical protein DFH94DRAFT_686873 [Russula ochroleuca]|jgi:hypothetical protein|uniref:Uncharacterized protein n=1 Tax=Russula ochroleuca TaxID=152965 RepID=A0A9P5JU98_9AGAM|nr:hypothetical protein DFH94DRAFT_686873 [Russula ochroleuca]